MIDRVFSKSGWNVNKKKGEGRSPSPDKSQVKDRLDALGLFFGRIADIFHQSLDLRLGDSGHIHLVGEEPHHAYAQEPEQNLPGPDRRHAEGPAIDAGIRRAEDVVADNGAGADTEEHPRQGDRPRNRDKPLLRRRQAGVFAQEVVILHAVSQVPLVLRHPRNDNADGGVEEHAPAGRVDGKRPAAPKLETHVVEYPKAELLGEDDADDAGQEAVSGALTRDPREPANGRQRRPHLEAEGHGEAAQQHQGVTRVRRHQERADDDETDTHAPGQLLHVMRGSRVKIPLVEIAGQNPAGRRHIGRTGGLHGRKGTDRQQANQPR